LNWSLGRSRKVSNSRVATQCLMIAKEFESTKRFLIERNSFFYFRVKKPLCRLKGRVSASSESRNSSWLNRGVSAKLLTLVNLLIDYGTHHRSN